MKTGCRSATYGWIIAAGVLVVTAGCMTRAPAPVSDRVPARVDSAARPSMPASQPDADGRPEFYTVRSGDTLYSIALEHGLDYKELADWNGIANVNVIRVGQRLRVRLPGSATVTAPVKPAEVIEGKPIGGRTGAAGGLVRSEPLGVRVPYSDQALGQLSAADKPAVATTNRPDARPDDKAVTESDPEKVDWGWPTNGRLSSGYSESANLKGIGISGKQGQPVVASAPGKVLYSGDGIRGYGKLVIIKHSTAFLSVYAHNSVLNVKEGQSVVKGQKIAEMGNTDSDQVKLHFEIRRFGKPVDPTRLLPAVSGPA